MLISYGYWCTWNLWRWFPSLLSYQKQSRPQDELKHAKQTNKCENNFQSTPAARGEG
jgi:hypothetical protein